MFYLVFGLTSRQGQGQNSFDQRNNYKYLFYILFSEHENQLDFKLSYFLTSSVRTWKIANVFS